MKLSIPRVNDVMVNTLFERALDSPVIVLDDDGQTDTYSVAQISSMALLLVSSKTEGLPYKYGTMYIFGGLERGKTAIMSYEDYLSLPEENLVFESWTHPDDSESYLYYGPDNYSTLFEHWLRQNEIPFVRGRSVDTSPAYITAHLFK